MARIFEHRIAFNCDLFMTIATASANTALEELEKRAQQMIREAARRSGEQLAGPEISDARLSVEGFDARNDVKVYPRVEFVQTPGRRRPQKRRSQLENLSIEDVSELEVT